MENWPKKIRALVDYPNSGYVKKEEIGVYCGRLDQYDFPSQKGYCVSHSYIGTKYEVIEHSELIYEIY